ncbi:hypothetical protein EPO34_02030 [Patescibacteria group bacterium]|nr:MAG: hypothetical protein EPO34_02030 [Patescibacteria group bacterium]
MVQRRELIDIANLPDPDPFNLPRKPHAIALKGRVQMRAEVGEIMDGVYVATESANDTDQDEQIVWEGDLLNRHVELGKRLALPENSPFEPCQVFRQPQEFVRGIDQAVGEYLVSVPNLKEAARELRLLRQQAKFVGHGGIAAVEGFREQANATPDRFGKPRNEHKVKAQKRLARGRVLADSRGRNNPSVVTYMLNLAIEENDARIEEEETVPVYLDTRVFVVTRLVGRVYDAIDAFDEQCTEAAAKPDDWWTPERRHQTADRIDAHAKRMIGMIISPFCRFFGYQCKKDFPAMAAALREGNLVGAKALFEKGRNLVRHLHGGRRYHLVMIPLSLAAKGKFVPTVEQLELFLTVLNSIAAAQPPATPEYASANAIARFTVGIQAMIECLNHKNGPNYDQAYEIGYDLHKFL